MKARIQQDLKTAVREQDSVKTGVLRMVLASISSKEKEKRYEISRKNANLAEAELEEQSRLTDEEVQDILVSEAKKRRESVEAFRKGGREDLVQQESQELEIIQAYLPEQLSDEELKAVVKEAVVQTDAKTIQDMGKVMAALMPKVKGRADGSRVSSAVKELLS